MAAERYTKTEKEAVRLLVIEIGATNTARRLGIKESTISTWATRYGWSKEMKPLGKRRFIVTPAQALIDEYKDLDGDSRISLARGLNKSARAVANMTGEDIIEKADKVKSVAQSVSLVHAWQADRPVNKISLSVTGANLKIEEEEVAIDAEWSDEPMD